MLKKIKTPAYLTTEQGETINNIKKIDSLLYSIDYTADYKIDEILANCKTGYDTDEAVSKILIPDSPYKLHFILGDMGCTCFSCINDKDEPVLGRNYDFYKTNHVCAICKTNNATGYSYIGALDMFFFGINEDNINETEKRLQFLYAPLQVLDGVNEKGLSCAILLLTEGKTIQKRGKTPILSTLIVSLLLSKCATVKEAETLLQNYDMVSFFKDLNENHHWILCDATGDRAVFEYVNNKLTVYRNEKDYLITSNFYASKPIKGQNGMGFLRVAIINHLLEMNVNPSDKQIMKYLETVKYSNAFDKVDFLAMGITEYSPGISYWSEVINTKTKTLSFVFKENYDKIYNFKL